MDLSKEKLLEVYRHMYQTRVFEHECEKLNKNKEILGSIHGSMGEEATSDLCINKQQHTHRWRNTANQNRYRHDHAEKNRIVTHCHRNFLQYRNEHNHDRDRVFC